MSKKSTLNTYTDIREAMAACCEKGLQADDAELNRLYKRVNMLSQLSKVRQLEKGNDPFDIA